MFAEIDVEDSHLEFEQDVDDQREELRYNIQNLFAPGNLTKSRLRELLESFNFHSDDGIELAARSVPSSVVKVPSSLLMEYTIRSVFTPSEILLHRLLMKHHWTEAEFQEVVDLVSSLQFKGEDVGYDLDRRVIDENLYFVCFSCVFRMCFVFLKNIS